MYTNSQSGQTAATTAAPTLHVGTFRRNILAVLVGCSLFTTAEQQRATTNVAACTDAARLALWLKNVRRVADERAQALATHYAPAPLPECAMASAHAAAQAVYKKAVARSRRLTIQRNELFAQLCPLRPDGFPVYVYAENPHRARLDAAHKAALAANNAALEALAQVQELEAQPAPSSRAATPTQCDELYRLACHPALTPAEKAHTLQVLPTLTEGAAVAYIGQLYAALLPRTGQQANSLSLTA